MMKVFENKKDLNITATAATVGFFDGVHCGHRFLFGELQTFARSLGLPSAVVTFTTHPRIVLHSDYQPLLLNTFEEKIDLLSDTGIDYAFVLDFTPDLAQFSAEQFIKEILYNQLNIRALLIGHDHRFGHQRREGFDEYVRYGSESGMVIKKATPYSDGEQVVSSSVIRRELEAGNVATAARMLGYQYVLSGTVAEGMKIGRSLGFPTANIRITTPKIIPKSGSYAVWVTVNGLKHKGMLYIGSRPSINKPTDELSIEVNIFDFAENIYNQPITVEFIEFIREDAKFGSLNDLRAQMADDKAKVESILNQ